MSDCPSCSGPDGVRWAAADGNEIVLYGADHAATLAGLGPAAVRQVVDLWAECTTAVGAHAGVGYVLVTETGGETAAHPHSEIHAYQDVPPVPAAELLAFPCRVCAEDPGDRLVAEAVGWRAWASATASTPYSVVLAPMSHRADLPTLGDWERDALAQLLADVLRRFDRIPYRLWVHQRPTDGGAWPNAHVHVEISGAPPVPTAAELGSGVHLNPVPPHEAAAHLRAAGMTA